MHLLKLIKSPYYGLLINSINESLENIQILEYYDADTDIKVFDNRKQAILDMVEDTLPRLNQSYKENAYPYEYARFVRAIRYHDGAYTKCIVAGYFNDLLVTEIPRDTPIPVCIFGYNIHGNTWNIRKIVTEMIN